MFPQFFSPFLVIFFIFFATFLPKQHLSSAIKCGRYLYYTIISIFIIPSEHILRYRQSPVLFEQFFFWPFVPFYHTPIGIQSLHHPSHIIISNISPHFYYQSIPTPLFPLFSLCFSHFHPQSPLFYSHNSLQLPQLPQLRQPNRVKSARKLQNNQSKTFLQSQLMAVLNVVYYTPVVSSTLRSVQTVSVSITPTLSKFNHFFKIFTYRPFDSILKWLYVWLL